MDRGKIIVIEGTDCSGKETQTKLLKNRLLSEGIKVDSNCFPRYDTTTGKIIGLPLLGKSYLADELIDNVVNASMLNILNKYSDVSENIKEAILSDILNYIKQQLSVSWFKEGAANVDAKIASLYYAIDRLYSINDITDVINNGNNIILDRYTYSNMGHQAGKLKSESKKLELINWIENLEFNFLGLPKADIIMFLYMPYEYSIELRKNRLELPDEVENDINYLKNSEETFLLMAKKYNYDVVNCVRHGNIRSIEDIHEEVYDKVKRKLK